MVNPRLAEINQAL